VLSSTQVPDGRANLAAYGTITRSGAAFQRLLLRLALVTPAIKGSPVLQPRRDESRRFGLIPVRSPLLRESLLLSFPGGNEMFQFPPLAACAYGFSTGQFGNPGISACLTAPPGLSQSSTPFIASWRQDIPHMPLVAWPHSSRARRVCRRPDEPTTSP
jgi:hypothetical protein